MDRNKAITIVTTTANSTISSCSMMELSASITPHTSAGFLFIYTEIRKLE